MQLEGEPLCEPFLNGLLDCAGYHENPHGSCGAMRLRSARSRGSIGKLTQFGRRVCLWRLQEATPASSQTCEHTTVSRQQAPQRRQAPWRVAWLARI